jgi:hypothetical protein
MFGYVIAASAVLRIGEKGPPECGVDAGEEGLELEMVGVVGVLNAFINHWVGK